MPEYLLLFASVGEANSILTKISIPSITAVTFYREVAENKILWTVRDGNGIPAPVNSDGVRVMPFWSSKNRAISVISNVPAYKEFESVSIDWRTFCEKWVPGLARDSLLVGINWTGKHATGYDIDPSEAQRNVEAVVENMT